MIEDVAFPLVIYPVMFPEVALCLRLAVFDESCKRSKCFRGTVDLEGSGYLARLENYTMKVFVSSPLVSTVVK